MVCSLDFGRFQSFDIFRLDCLNSEVKTSGRIPRHRVAADFSHQFRDLCVFCGTSYKFVIGSEVKIRSRG